MIEEVRGRNGATWRSAYSLAEGEGSYAATLAEPLGGASETVWLCRQFSFLFPDPLLCQQSETQQCCVEMATHLLSFAYCCCQLNDEKKRQLLTLFVTLRQVFFVP